MRFLALSALSLGVSLLSFLRSEVTRGYLVSEDEDLYTEKQRRVLTFWKTPRELEKVSSERGKARLSLS